MIVVSSIALRKAISGAPSSLGTPSVSSGTATSTSRTRVTSVFDSRISATDLGIGQDFAALGLLDLARALKQRVEVAVFADQLRRRLDADAARAGHVVGGIAGERLDVDDLVGAEAEIGDDFVRADAPLLAIARGRVEHRHARPDELHEVLVGGDDQHVGAPFARLARIGGDEIVGLVAVLLDRRQAERAHRLAHQRELRHQVLGRIGPMGLVGRIDFAPEGILRLVEDDRQMRRLDPRRAVAQELQNLGREQPHRADRQPVGTVIVFLILPDRLEIGAKDEGRAVDEKDVVAGADGTGSLGHGAIVDNARGGGYRRALAFQCGDARPFVGSLIS